MHVFLEWNACVQLNNAMIKFKGSTNHKSSNQCYAIHALEGLNKMEENYHSSSTIKHTLVFLNSMVSEHVFMNLVSLLKFQPPRNILRLGKIVCVLGISTTHTNCMFASWEYSFINACNPHASAMHQETQQHQPLKVQEALSKLVDAIQRV